MSLEEDLGAGEVHSLDTQLSPSEPLELYEELDVEPGHPSTEKQAFSQRSPVTTPTSPASSLTEDSEAEEDAHSLDSNISLPEPLELHRELGIQPGRPFTEEQVFPQRSSVSMPTSPASSPNENSEAGEEVHSVDTKISLPEPLKLHGELDIEPGHPSTEEQGFLPRSSVSTPTSPASSLNGDSGAGEEVQPIDTKTPPESLELHGELDIPPDNLSFLERHAAYQQLDSEEPRCGQGISSVSNEDSMQIEQIPPQATGTFLPLESTPGTSVQEFDAFRQASEAPLCDGATSLNPCEASAPPSDDILEVEPLQPEDTLDVDLGLDRIEDSEGPADEVDNVVRESDSTQIPSGGSDDTLSSLLAHQPGHPSPSEAQVTVPHWSEYADPTADMNIAFCRFFAQARCLQGYNCKFRHSLSISEYTLLFRDSQPTLWSYDTYYPQATHIKPPISSGLGTCKFYPLGKCRNGDACTFTHTASPDFPYSQEQFPTSVDPENTSYAPQFKSKTPCKFYMEQGSCRNGDVCRFDHGGSGLHHSQLSNGDGAGSDNVGEQTWEDQGTNAFGGNSGARTVCRWYRQGRCHNGDKCNFIHEQTEDNTWKGDAPGWDDWNNPAAASWGEPLNGKTVAEQERPEKSTETAESIEGPVAEEETLPRMETLEDPTVQHDSTIDEWPAIDNDPWSTGVEDLDTPHEIRTDEHIPDTRSDATDAPHETDMAVKEDGPEEAQNQMDVVASSDPVTETWDWEPSAVQEPSGTYKKKAPCKAFGQGYCSFGDSCRYMHINEAPEQPPPQVEVIEPPHENIVPQLELQLDTEVPQLTTVSYVLTFCSSLDFVPQALGSSLVERTLFNCAVCFSSTDGCSPIEITSASESRRVLLFNLPPNVEHPELHRLGEQIAGVDYIDIEYAEAGARATIDFNRPTEAALAAAQLDGQIYNGNALIARLDSIAAESVYQPLACHSVKITWLTPTRFAWAFYPTITIAKNEATRLNGQTFEGRQITATFHRPRPKQTDAFAVRLTGLPKDATLESVQTSCIHSSLVTLGDPTYKDDPITNISGLLANAGYLDSLLVLPANPGTIKQIAFARFSGELSGVMKLHGAAQPFLGKDSLSIQKVYHTNFKVSKRKSQAINVDFEQLYESHKDSCNFHIHDEGEPIIIHISSNVTNGTIFGKLNQQLQSLLRGQTVECDGEILWDEYFDLTSSAKAIEKINGDLSFFVEIDNRSQSVRVVGSTIGQQRARSAIARLLKRVRDQRQVIPLLDPISLQRLLDGAFTTLQGDIGANKVTLDVTVPQLIVRGDAEALHKVQLTVGTTQSPPEDLAGPTEGQVCPLCCRAPAAPMGLSCDHVYCRTCLQHVLQASTGSLFIAPRCIAATPGTDDELDVQCMGHIPYPLIHELLDGDEEHSLLRSSFLAYVHDHPDKFFLCPTPNCETLYGRGRKGARYCCPLCLTEVCTWCMTEYHEGLPCHSSTEEAT